MRLACFLNDPILYKKIIANPIFTNITLIHESGDLIAKVDEFDVILVSDIITPYDVIPDFRSHFPNATIFYMVSNSSNYKRFQKIETLCHAHDVYIVYPKQTPDQIVSFVTGVLKPVDDTAKNPIVSFVGAQSKVGVTTTVFSIATRLGMCTEAKIGVLGLNSINPGTQHIKEYDGAYLDELKTTLSNKMLSTSNLISEMQNLNHFYYLAGNRDIKKRLHYTIKEIHYLIEQAKKSYDLVLVDAGSNYDDALCIQSLLNADTKFLVTSQLNSALDAWNRVYEQVLEPTGIAKQDFLMIINQFRNKPHFPDIKQLVQEYGIPNLRHISDVGDLGIVAEVNRNFIIDYDEPEYLRDIDFIAKALIKTYKLKTKESKVLRRPGLIHKILRYRGV